MRNKVTNLFCAAGCPPGSPLQKFPNNQNDAKRRKYWLDFFDLEEPNTEYIYACKRHFSYLQQCKEGLLKEAVPDISVICEGTITPFKRKPKNWRNNVIVVTPRDPEFAIYRNETGVFPQDLFNNTNTVPIIKSVSCSVSTQTNKHLCGTVEISDIFEEFHLNCFYCREMFPLDKWQNFQKHLKLKHFQQEVAFKRSTLSHLLNDHDYTPITSPTKILPQKRITSVNVTSNPIIQMPQPIFTPYLIEDPKTYAINTCLNTQPSPLLCKPQAPTPSNTLDISLADKLINLLNETILNPIFLANEEDNIIVIKNSSSNGIETSTYLTKLMQTTENSENISSLNSETKDPFKPCPKNKRPIYTLNQGLKNIPCRRSSTTRRFLNDLPKSKYCRRIAKQTLKSINIFENIYKTVKKRFPQDIELPNDPSNSKATERNTKQTALSRCLKRSDTLTIETVPQQQLTLKPNSTELVFQYTPEDIMVSLLDYMKEYPVLWEFHDEPFNKNYAKAVVSLCKKINEKWSLNITSIKMIRSVNRILRFYRFMLDYENVEQYTDYYDKCALFLPLEAEKIPRTRCPYCWICFKRDVDLRRHMSDKHNSGKWIYKCKTCFERFRERDSYEMHKRLPHYKEVFKCEKCLKRFDKRGLYNKHYNNHIRTEQKQLLHVEIVDDEKVEEENSVVQEVQETPVVQEVQEPLDLDCDISYSCDKCSRIFISKKVLDDHKATFHKPKKIKILKCPLCPKEYFQKTYLNFHLKRHYKQYDFMCDVCGKKFIRQDCLNNHMETHTGAKITCNICNLKLRKVSLSRHLRLVHVATEGTIESTYRSRCYQYKRFNPTYKGPQKPKSRSYESLPRHYQCKICKINFSRLKLLKDHNNIEHPDAEKLPCKICSLELKRKNSLKRHYISIHKLHPYQAFKLMYHNDDVETVLSMQLEQLENKSNLDYLSPLINPNIDLNNSSVTSVSCASDQLQDEIMKAVENIDEQQMKIDDEHSMNNFFGELLK